MFFYLLLRSSVTFHYRHGKDAYNTVHINTNELIRNRFTLAWRYWVVVLMSVFHWTRILDLDATSIQLVARSCPLLTVFSVVNSLATGSCSCNVRYAIVKDFLHCPPVVRNHPTGTTVLTHKWWKSIFQYKASFNIRPLKIVKRSTLVTPW